MLFQGTTVLTQLELVVKITLIPTQLQHKPNLSCCLLYVGPFKIRTIKLANYCNLIHNIVYLFYTSGCVGNMFL